MGKREMSNTLYFKDMNKKDEHNMSQVIYKVEEFKIFLEVIDNIHLIGLPRYFSSIRARDDFINEKRNHLIRINEKEVDELKEYWKSLK